jgi:hypothetical protein
VQTIASAFAFYLPDRFGRRWILISMAIVMALCMFVVSIVMGFSFTDNDSGLSGATAAVFIWQFATAVGWSSWFRLPPLNTQKKKTRWRKNHSRPAEDRSTTISTPNRDEHIHKSSNRFSRSHKRLSPASAGLRLIQTKLEKICRYPVARLTTVRPGSMATNVKDRSK